MGIISILKEEIPTYYIEGSILKLELCILNGIPKL